MSSSNQSSEARTPMQSAISDLAKQISHLAVAQADSGVQQPHHVQTSLFDSVTLLILWDVFPAFLKASYSCDHNQSL